MTDFVDWLVFEQVKPALPVLRQLIQSQDDDLVIFLIPNLTFDDDLFAELWECCIRHVFDCPIWCLYFFCFRLKWLHQRTILAQ